MTDTKVPVEDLIASAKSALPTKDYLERKGSTFKRHGKFWRTCCPLHSERTPSFDVFDDGGFKCRGCDRHGDVIDLVVELEGLKGPVAAARWILGDNAPKPAAAVPSRRKPAEPLLAHDGSLAPPKPGDKLRIRKGDKGWTSTKLTRVAEYFDYDGQLVGFEVRYPKHDGSGKMFNFLVAHQGEWHDSKLASPMPVYNGHAIPPDVTVVVLEGTKKPDMFNALGLPGYYAVGYIFGVANWRHCDWTPLTGRNVLLLPDSKGSGAASFQQLSAKLTKDFGCTTDMVSPRADLGDNIDDYIDLHRWTADDVLEHITVNTRNARLNPASIPQVSPDAWRTDPRLVTKEDGQPNLKSRMNGAIWLERHPLMHQAFRLNLLSDNLEWTRSIDGISWADAGRILDDKDYFQVSLLMEQLAGMSFDKGQIVDMMYSVANNARWTYHPVRDYLKAIHWDGTMRLDHWLVTYCGAEDMRINRVFGVKWAVSAVARAFDPGCKVDTVLVLEGEQGLQKSKVFQLLAGGVPQDVYLPNLEANDKEAPTRCEGKWIVEMAELDGLNKGETSRFKAFCTTQVDKIRKPYARSFITIPRQFVLGGTVNPDGGGYLRDPTGNRRFWPVEVTRIDTDQIKRDRDQLWAEAMFRYERGDKWWLTPDEELLAKPVVQEREQIDPWLPLIAEKIKGRNRVTVEEMFMDPLQIENSKRTKIEQMRIAQILKSLGLQRKKSNGQVVWERVR